MFALKYPVLTQQTWLEKGPFKNIHSVTVTNVETQF